VLCGSLSPGHGAYWVVVRDGLQICCIAANILNKKSMKAENGWCSSFGVGRVANKSPVKIKQVDTKCFTGHREKYIQCFGWKT